jgi:hypothetical protein
MQPAGSSPAQKRSTLYFKALSPQCGQLCVGFSATRIQWGTIQSILATTSVVRWAGVVETCRAL